MKQNIWPDDAKCSVCFTFDLDAEWVFQGNHPEVADMPRRLSQGEYVWNAKIIPRILNLLDEYDLVSTFFVVGINAKNHPEIMQDIVSRGHEIATHGWKHEDIVNVGSEEEERRLLMSMDAIESSTGIRPVGNRIAGGEISPNSYDILVRNKFIYDSSMRGSDLPYRSKNGLIIIPSYYEMDDFHLFADYPGYAAYYARMMSPEVGWEIWTNSFDGYYKYGLCYTTMFHPQIIGKPGNMMLLERLIQYIKKHPNVWISKAEDITRHWHKHTRKI